MYHFYTHSYASTTIEEFNSQISHFYKLELIEFKPKTAKKRKPALIQKYISSDLHKNIQHSIEKFSAKLKSVNKPKFHTFAPVSHETTGKTKLQRLTLRNENTKFIRSYIKQRRHITGDETSNTSFDKSYMNAPNIPSLNRVEDRMKDVVKRESILVQNIDAKALKLPLMKTRKNDRIRFDTREDIHKLNSTDFKSQDERQQLAKDKANRNHMRQNFINSVLNPGKPNNFKRNILVKELMKYHSFFKKFAKTHKYIREGDFDREFKQIGNKDTLSGDMFRLIAKNNKKVQFKHFVKYFRPELSDQELNDAIELMNKVLMLDNKFIDAKGKNLLHE